MPYTDHVIPESYILLSNEDDIYAYDICNMLEMAASF